MTALVVGATGLVGSELLKKILHSKSYTKVITVARQPLVEREIIQNHKLKQIIVNDFESLNLYFEDLKADHYFCCLGTTIKKAKSKENFIKVDYTAIVNIAEIAKRHSASYFALVSAKAANSKSFIFYNKIKGQTEDKLISLGLSSLAIFRPALLIGHRTETRKAEKLFIDVYKALKNFLPQKITAEIGTPVDTLTNKMLEAALGPAKKVLIFESKGLG